MNKHWTEWLQERWKLKNIWEVIIVLIVFACTGFTIFFIKKPILRFLAGDAGNNFLATFLYYLFILPLYNILLLLYGLILGKFSFFWNFEKRFFNRIIAAFRRRQ